MGKLQTGILATLLLPALALAAKPDRVVQADWVKLEKLVKGKRATVLTTTGQSIEGKIRRVGGDSIELDKHREVARADVRAVRIAERHGHWRLWGTLIGLFGTAVIGSAIAGGGNGKDGSYGVALIPFAAGLVGYYAGREADKQSLFIEVLP